MAMHEGLPLVGIQVVDFGQYIAGPLTARLLADAGATVTKIDPPDGAPQLSACACAFARPPLQLRLHGQDSTVTKFRRHPHQVHAGRATQTTCSIAARRACAST
jgi:crotonobetainyl-CoA:carnitine CoA-transferase CaiB-like acyl-CoA transferase